jgi:alkylhydroperoxidase family enzyme
MSPAWSPGRYTLQKLRRELSTHLPVLARELPRLLADLPGVGLGLETRLAFQLRMARLFGCPVCLEIFPRLGVRAGLDARAVQAALDGQLDGLPAEAAGAVAWAEAVITGGGGKPELVPGAAMALSGGQRDHLLYLARVEQVVHATGLMLLPHRMIERALGG